MPLIAHYPLHEDSGNAIDIVGGNDGTVNGATQGATGLLGTSAYSFDGSDDDIRATTVSGDYRTISFWVYPFSDISNAVSFRMITHDHDDVNAYTVLGSYSSDLPSETVSIGDGNGNTGIEESFPANNWYHIVFRWNGSTYDIYVNAVQYDTVHGDSNGSTGLQSGWNLSLAARTNNSDRYYDGRLCDVRLYDHSLSPQEIQYLYNVVAGEATLTTAIKGT